ncbi:A24 family peptidase [Calidifontibacillus oryziterrae]|uniref:A24 family peptidase n=1 Tax=Calidifontibacillus oryziterrae TaxID=1191699 RepID=UPI00030544D5|nr:prepilin peptidase [Calidifontibacillus oryziterrae]
MIVNGILIIVLLICIVTDLKERKIYNKVIFPALLLAFLYQAMTGGWNGLQSAFFGFLVGLGVLLIPYLLGGMGAGDVKLLALIGALKGTVFVLNTAIYMALIGGIIALFILLFRKGVIERIKGILYFLHARRYGLKTPILLNKEALTATYPYGLAIAGGAFVSLLAKGWIIL